MKTHIVLMLLTFQALGQTFHFVPGVITIFGWGDTSSVFLVNEGTETVTIDTVRATAQSSLVTYGFSSMGFRYDLPTGGVYSPNAPVFTDGYYDTLGADTVSSHSYGIEVPSEDSLRLYSFRLDLCPTCKAVASGPWVADTIVVTLMLVGPACADTLTVVVLPEVGVAGPSRTRVAHSAAPNVRPEMLNLKGQTVRGRTGTSGVLVREGQCAVDVPGHGSQLRGPSD